MREDGSLRFRSFPGMWAGLLQSERPEAELVRSHWLLMLMIDMVGGDEASHTT